MNGLELEVSNIRVVSDDEAIRFIYVLYYGLTLVRTMNWIKNRIHFLQRIIRDRVSFYKFIQKIKDWNSRRFNIERRIKYMCYSLFTYQYKPIVEL